MAPRPPGRAQLEEYQRRAVVALRWRPEWPFVLVIVAAWALLLTGLGPGQGNHPAVHDRPVHVHAAGTAGHGEWGTVVTGLPAALAAWTVMSVAMMLPVALPAARHVALNSIRKRRARAMTIFVAAYVAVWVLFGLPTLLGVRAAVVVGGVGDRSLLLIALAVAACWQASGIKRRSLAQCRRTVPLPPVGRRADAACARFGFLHGRRCLVSCWPLMVLMVVVVHGAIGWMIALTALVCAEELTRVGHRLPGLSAVALILTATFLIGG